MSTYAAILVLSINIIFENNKNYNQRASALGAFHFFLICATKLFKIKKLFIYILHSMCYLNIFFTPT